jgi:hypothetical protein
MRQLLLAGILLLVPGMVLAEGPRENDPNQPVLASPVIKVEPVTVPEAPSAHKKFWDRTNIIMVSAFAGTTALDFAATQRNLAGPTGGTEHNPLAQPFMGSTPGRVAYFGGAAAGTVGLSYLFHKTGHHKLEHATLMIGIGCSTQGAVYSFMHH